MSELKIKGKKLQDVFFNFPDEFIDSELSAMKGQLDDKILLQRVSGITTKSILDNAVHLGITAKTFAAFNLIPLLKVAWADGILEDGEVSAIKDCAKILELDENQPAYKLMNLWLSKKMNGNLFVIWKEYVSVLKTSLTEVEFELYHDEILKRSKSVARACGGFLKLGSINDFETKALEDIEAAFA